MGKPVLNQIWVASGVLLATILLGVTVGILSCLLQDLDDPKSSLKVTLEEKSWIATSYGLAWIPGYLTSSIYMDYFGRKVAFILNITPGAVGLLLMYFATDIYTLIASRFLQGITSGSVTVLGSIVLGEYTSPTNRGMFLNLKTTAMYTGSALVHFMGSFYHYRTLALLSLVPYAINYVIIFTWPESPAWLLSEKRIDECTKNFHNLRGKNAEATRELNDMIKTYHENTSIIKEKSTGLKNVKIFFLKHRQRDFVKPLTVLVFSAILLETTGRHVYPAYAIQMLSKISGEINPYYLTLGFDILVTVSSLFSSVLVKMAGKRFLLLSTGSFACVVLLTVCGYLYLVSKEIISVITWVPLLLFSVYFAVVNFACSPIPLGLIGELFPLHHKAVGTTIGSVLIASMATIAYKTYPVLVATVEIYGTFFIFGILMAISLVFLYFLLPEIKDRSLVEIEYFFNHGKFEERCERDEDNVNTQMLP